MEQSSNANDLFINLDDIWEKINKKIEYMMKNSNGKAPHVSKSGTYDDMRIDFWTSGFWPGILWICYDMTGNEAYRNEAWKWDQRIEECFVRESNLHHDVGFQFLPTAVIKYKLTGDTDAKRRAFLAATFLAGRFNIVGNYIRAWNVGNMNQNRSGRAIIDSMMNISLLFWASEELEDPRFRHIANAHAHTVLKHFIREDGSVAHIIDFDSETGEYIESIGGQGYSSDSAWSRGQAWAIYGMVNAYKYTGNECYLKAAQRVAHFFISSLPDDCVPYWDFRIPDYNGEPRDTSAASCAASGMLEIAKYLPNGKGNIYRTWAEKIIQSLTDNYSTLDKIEHEGLLVGATSNANVNKETANVSLIYGDYFYVECIAKLKGWTGNIF